ncbi:phytoene desaturase family protein [Mycobacterium stomatepiae]|uniref:Pyridine nucleotide-disulfide oxidoreductase domain-containing protein 2 n=1 Tax=Mycobacterium stomatepiae TaxID=470076 RepID=A0A7I7QIB2_9MYCO|nr:NAD(P)/FAD-dependent oxidoreductase [Mycobacterium stomatepiae]MCV7166018.1 NAD(P)/FAD-dependent oxidoreductase [Mycobacterium stomatepiae]BBY25817.1 beta-carotene ketolase [Mycobacterium stomatepiae]
MTENNLPTDADYLIIGAGHNGLTAACYLARAGFRVAVVEASPTVGGMTSTNATLSKAPGHYFNEGAIQLTGIFQLSGVAEDLQLHKYGLRRISVDPAHIQLAPDGSSLAIWKDASRTADELRRFSPKDARAWLDMANALDPIMDVVVAYMKSHPLRPFNREMAGSLFGAARHLKKIAGLRNMITASHTEFLEETFETELPKGALAAMAAFSQMRLDATAWAMIYLGVVQKVANAMPVGGAGALLAALHRCLTALGGTVHTNTRVQRLAVSNDRVTGVQLESGRFVAARKGVLTTCNPVVTLNELLPEGTLDTKLSARAKDIPIRKTHATSLKINVALEGQVTMKKHEDWRGDGLDLRKYLIAWHTLKEQDDAWNAVVRGQWPDPVPVSCAIIPTAVDPTQAPEGRDNLWLWSGVIPATPEEPWDDVRDKVGDAVLRDTAQHYQGLDKLEIDRAVLGGPDLEERFNAPAGNVYHVDPLITRFGPLKPAAGLGGYRTPVQGLYLSGAGTHPVGGVCALPGKLAAQTAIRDQRKQ